MLGQALPAPAPDRRLRPLYADAQAALPLRLSRHVYRNETTDARHERAFFQYEALIVDKEFGFASGEVMIKSILSKVFGRDVPVRMRAGFFPFVEPGFELDISCLICGGEGCPSCKNSGWLELCPCGMIHPTC